MLELRNQKNNKKKENENENKNNNLLKFHISGSYVVYVQSIINARSNNIDTKPVNTTPSFLVIHKQHLSGHCGHIVDVSLVILRRSLNLN